MEDSLTLHREALDQHDVITAKLRAQVSQLREDLTEKNNVILALEEEIESLVSFCNIKAHVVTFFFSFYN